MLLTAALRLLALTTCFFALLADAARADMTTLAGVDAPIVRVNVRRGDVTVRTWDRQAVGIDGDTSLRIERRPSRLAAQTAPILIPQAAASTADGRIVLPPESFVVSVPPGLREQILVRSPLDDVPGPVLPLTVTIPSSTVLLVVHTGDGNLDVHGYQTGTLVSFVGRGRMTLDSVGGTVFAQTGRGPLAVNDSTFERIRARSLFGNVTFERCRSRQIEATSVNGSIVYDGGSFEPGLARFESTRGDVAIGTLGAAEIGARAGGPGKVFTSFGRGARVDGREGQASAVLGGGGPVVTAASQAGNVYLYDGSLRSRSPSPGTQWQVPLDVLEGRQALRREEVPRDGDAARRGFSEPYRPRPAPSRISPWSRFKLRPKDRPPAPHDR